MPCASSAESVLPGLKPYHPNHRIKPAPPEPEDQPAGGADDQVVRLHRSAAVALEDASEPRSKRDCARQRDDSSDRVDDGGSREVVEVNRIQIGQPSVRTPCPVSDDRIDEAGDADAIEQVADEIAAPDHCS